MKQQNFNTHAHKGEVYNAAKVTTRILRTVQTPAESIFWEAVSNRKLDGLKFYRQRPFIFSDIDASSFYIADFYCHELRLVIEIDGPIHKQRSETDNHRTEILESRGLTFIRFTNQQIEMNLPEVLQKIVNIKHDRTKK